MWAFYRCTRPFQAHWKVHLCVLGTSNVAILKEKLRNAEEGARRAEQYATELEELKELAASKEEEVSQWKGALGPDISLDTPHDLHLKFAKLQAEVLEHVDRLAETQTALKYSQGPRSLVWLFLYPFRKKCEFNNSPKAICSDLPMHMCMQLPRHMYLSCSVTHLYPPPSACPGSAGGRIICLNSLSRHLFGLQMIFRTASNAS